MKSRLLFLFLLLFSFKVTIAALQAFTINDSLMQKSFSKDTIWPKYSSNYFDDYSNMLGLFIQAKQKKSWFKITNPVTNDVIDYSPKNQVYMGLGFHYKLIGNGLSLNFGFLQYDKDEKDKTSRLDMHVNVIFKKLVYDFDLRYYKNFSLKNPEDVFPDSINIGQEYIRPDIQTAFLGVGAVYVFNYDKFSYRAAFTQTAIQKKSAGSFMLGSQIFLQGLKGDSSIFPSNSKFSNLPLVTIHSSLYIGLKMAYAYNFIIKKHFFVALTLASALEFGKSVSELEDGEVFPHYKPILHLQPRASIGLNKPKWYVGASYNRDTFLDLSSSEYKELVYSFRSENFRLFFGMRFNWLSRKKT